MNHLQSAVGSTDLPNSSPFSHPVRTSKSVDREPTAEEEQLSKLLIEQVLPPFNKTMRLQAMVVYQADEEKMNCLLVNRRYHRSGDATTVLRNLNEDRGDKPDSSQLSDSGFMDSSTVQHLFPESPTNCEDVCGDKHRESGESPQTVSRRKRKLCRPCKIPQSGPLPAADVDIVSTPDHYLSAQFASEHSPRFSPQKSAESVTYPESSPVNQNGVSDGMLLPVSAVTLLPRVSVFSLPVTVLSTLPRPILPRVSFDRPTTSASLLSFPVPTPIVQPTFSRPNLMPVTTESTVSSAESIDLTNRRFGKSFVCNQCRKDFASLNLLCAHTFSVHRGFRCTICRAQFTQRSNLQRHSLRHVGFKPFVCKVCDKAYYRKDHLVRHIELSHPGCDPRLSLTVKLSSAECLDYLDKLQQNSVETEQAQILCQLQKSPRESEFTNHLPNDSNSNCTIEPNSLAVIQRESPELTAPTAEAAPES